MPGCTCALCACHHRACEQLRECLENRYELNRVICPSSYDDWFGGVLDCAVDPSAGVGRLRIGIWSARLEAARSLGLRLAA
jgi:hypothetical protein